MLTVDYKTSPALFLSLRECLHRRVFVGVVFFAGLILSVGHLPQAVADSAAIASARPVFSPPLRQPPENNLYWGDLHLHTNLSADAYINGTRQVTPDDAYRFAKGERVIADNGVEARLRRPLDFLAITDHSENLGLYARIEAGDPLVVGQPVGDRYSEVLDLFATLGLRDAFFTVMRKHGPMPDIPEKLKHSVWNEVADLADTHNQPGRFTALIGYEWTSMINGDNLHRVVLFRDSAKKVTQQLPMDANINPDPEYLWQGLSQYETATGGQVLAIAHNGNLSNGRMFSPKRVNGEAMDRQYAERRARWEPVYEVTQVKGDGETHPDLSPLDEFADFETWDKTNVASTADKEPWMLRYEYARSALLDGLSMEQQLGANPFKFGMIGSTDSHTGLATTEEDNFFGKFKGSEPAADRALGKMGGQFEPNWELGASGLTAVWAPENTREAIFDALRRREVYATTGSRIGVRFFAGWQFVQADIERADYVRHAYRHGVPMGSDLPPSEQADAPTFLIHAVRDPDAANLDRVQVVKGWLDEDGQPQEKIYNVALSNGRTSGQNGQVKAIESTVDVGSAAYRTTKGSAELATWWKDPDFNVGQPAFYYLRVLEIPRPRWTTYDASFFGTDLPEGAPTTIQDRAYSSPIWYRP